MATLQIEISKTGVDQVRARARTIADGIEVGRLIEASAVGLRLLDSSIVEYFNRIHGAEIAHNDVPDEPAVWIKTDRDGMLDLPRKIRVQVGTLPRDAFDAPPSWFVEGCKKLFPEEDWADDAEETAVALFGSACSFGPLLDHWGWIGECDDNDALISEPYRAHWHDLKNLGVICDEAGWKLSIQGVSGHYPSATFRIVINPKEKGFCHVR
jgi:hypothetical protein